VFARRYTSMKLYIRNAGCFDVGDVPAVRGVQRQLWESMCLKIV
jgi:hypothetical protein